MAKPTHDKPSSSSNDRLKAWALLLVFMASGHLNALALQESGQAAARTLVPGAPLDGEFSGVLPHSYRVAVTSGEFVQIFVQQKGVEVAASLLDPAGRKLEEFDDSGGESEQREILFIGKSDGNYRLLLRPLMEGPPTVRYQIRLEILRPATEHDEMRIRAMQALKGARQVFWKMNSLSLEEAKRFAGKFEEALELWRTLDDRRMIAETLLSRGMLDDKIGEFGKALETYENALRLFPETPDGITSRATTLNNMAADYHNLGETRRALECYLKSLELKKEGRSRAITLDNLGSVYHRLGEYQLALDHHQQALTIFRELGGLRDQSVALNNLAVVLGSIGDLNRSLEYLLEALAVIRKTRDRNAEASSLQKLGACYLNMGDSVQALDYANRSIDLSRTLNNHRLEADGLTLACRIYNSIGEFDKAREACNRALPMHQHSGDRPSEAATLSTLGHIYELTREPAEAVQSRKAALALYRQSDDPAGELASLHALGRLALDGGDLATARTELERAIEMTESLRVKVGSHQLRSSYMAGLQNIYETYVDLLMQMHLSEPGKGYEQAALQFSERARARGLLDRLAEARLQIRQGADAAAMEKERGLLERLTSKDAAWRRLRNDGRTKSQADVIAHELNDLTTQLQLVEGQIRSSSPRYAELTQPQLLTHAEIQRQLLDGETVLLEFSLGKRQSWLWAVTPDATLTLQLPAQRQIETAARRVCELLTARQPRKGETEIEWRRRFAEADAELPQASRSLSRMLFGGLGEELRQEWKGKRLLIIAGGALEYIPFGALPAPSDENVWEPLIAGHEIVNLPSASVLAAIRREAVGRRLPTKAVAVLADPVFEETDPRVMLARKSKQNRREPPVRTRGPGTDHAPESDLTRSVRSIDRETLSRLPFSREEAETIASLAPRGSLLKATDFRANRATATGGELSNYRMVHLATHGLLNSEHPELSGLVLSLVDQSGKPQDGFVRMHEIYNLHLPADIVVLSACQTGLGKEIRGEGLVGLTRGFMYAGAQRVVASLWQVDDLATAELMKRFYRGMLKDGMRPAAALRAAQLELAKEKRWSSPFYWAAFVLQGEWK